MAARRIPLEKPPTLSDEAKVTRQRDVWRARIGANIKKARVAAGLSQRQLSMRADVSANYLGQAELGRRGITIDFLVRVGYHLGISPDAFLSEEM
jgi:ribosome-binding protein aMBF1 (putative translation factor)